MLEMALRGERSKFLSTTNALASNSSPSPSGTASPIPGGAISLGPGTPNLSLGPGAVTDKIKLPSEKDKDLLSAINPAKLAALQKETAPSASTTTNSVGEVKSAAMAPSTSSPGVPAGLSQPESQPHPSLNFQPSVATSTGTWGLTMGGTLSGRDPRGKARSRDYLKQCLQEITYLTSATTLNPLSNTSYAAPQIPRPRKVLPDYVPAPAASQPPASSTSLEAQPLASTSAVVSNKVPGVLNLTGILPPKPAPTPSAPTASAATPNLAADASATPPSYGNVPSSSLPESIPLATSNGLPASSVLATAPAGDSSTSISSAFVPLERSTAESSVIPSPSKETSNPSPPSRSIDSEPGLDKVTDAALLEANASEKNGITDPKEQAPEYEEPVVLAEAQAGVIPVPKRDLTSDETKDVNGGIQENNSEAQKESKSLHEPILVSSPDKLANSSSQMLEEEKEKEDSA